MATKTKPADTYFTHDKIKKLADKELVHVGNIIFPWATPENRTCRLCVLNYELFAMIFSVSSACQAIMDKPEAEQDPTDRWLLSAHLSSIAEQRLAPPLLEVIAESFEDEDVLTKWGAYLTYMEGPPRSRMMVLYPTEKPICDHRHYVGPLLTRARQEGKEGPSFKLSFEPPSED